RIGSLNDLSFGDYVVHENHGLGIYRGIEKIEVEKVIKDYIKIEYGDGGNLYVPATGLDVIQKYAAADAAKKPKLNKLNSVEWKNTKTRVRGAVRDLAKELVELYALRSAKKGFACEPDTVWQKEMEELFPYEETDDQLRAIEEIKKDMESTRIMDRLLCGDVGYGKTEVALRAAFKAVSNGKQVIVLVPTTILAQQHYNTFTQRMMQYPVRIELLSRFRTPAQQKAVLDGFQKGLVDIVIGTHRVLSKDVQAKNLGLLIVDEEQRFGVAHKEKIKQMKGDVDVLTLTATPIPRTLHMSLVGIRDMSILEEPPVDRLPIQTFVLEQNDEMVREAVCRELARGGQVYYVYNRVHGIEEVAAGLAKMLPEANVAYAHGQMSERTLEKIMYEFINGEIDVLVSTTIIETGLDISNVNTMIIADADRLGLSQLYQLRGRVGRTNRTAYAFLMYKRDKILKEVAEKRLQAIKEFTELGSGFKIAMRDLEIRGAGNLLGAEQSGHMEAVGYDLYCKLLNDAVRELKGDEPAGEEFDTAVDLEADAYIPETYIRNEMQKLDMYKRIALIRSEEELSELQDELIDRFG
ncbi:MAG: transcription-repair coupling factor, partial [Lachnospiraceae bacterium]